MAEQDAYQSTNGNGQYEQTYEEQSAMDAGAGDASGTTGDRINASKNDDDSRKIFVGGLSWETAVQDMKDYFAKFGEVLDCTLKTDPSTGRSRGFGFVLFANNDSVDAVINHSGHTLHGRNIDPKRAKARGGREPIKKVFVGGLDPELPESDIRDYFGKFGKIEEIDLPFDKMKNQRRAFCFITFESEEIVDRVCENAKQTVGNKEVDVKKATPKSEQGGFGGRGGRGGFGGYGGGRGGFGGRGGGRGGRGGYNQGYGQGYGQGGYDYYGQGYGQGGYDYSQGYGGGYDYNSYYGQGWGGYGGGSQGYGGGYGNGGGGYGDSQQNKPYASKRGGSAAAAGGGGGYHPYSR